MTPIVQVGTILINEVSPRMAEVLALESEPYLEHWNVVKALDGFTLNDKIRAAGWNFFFLAGEVKVMFFGAIGATKLRGALKRILWKVKQQNFNSLEVTSIVAKRFLGMRYGTVSAHSRHIQQSCQLDSSESRRRFQKDAELDCGEHQIRKW
jgi:hypothetical protein